MGFHVNSRSQSTEQSARYASRRKLVSYRMGAKAFPRLRFFTQAHRPRQVVSGSNTSRKTNQRRKGTSVDTRRERTTGKEMRTKTICPKCGGHKSFAARTCQACFFPPKFETGKRFGYLTVLRTAGSSSQGITYELKCDCGEVIIASGDRLKRGQTACHCGLANQTHGHSNPESKTYRAWNAMKRRCFNPTHKSYANYGGRGITVCDRWLQFENFLADMGESPPDLSIDRINNNGNYEPKNCRWATRSEQQRNKRNTRRLSTPEGDREL